MSEFAVEQATRVGVVPLIDVYGESGTGKSMSALLLARGIAGPSGEIVGIDTENRRLSLYADVIPGGFKVINLPEPYSPDRYIEAMKKALEFRPAVIVIDSASHEHEGAGGILDMAAKNEEESKRAGLHNWRKPKFEHAKFVQFMLRCPVPVICCIRAKYKTRQKKGTQQMFDAGLIERHQIGKTIIERDPVTSPIQAEDFIFEATAHFEILPDHSIILTKSSHPDLRACFPKDKTTPITIEHGKAIAQWCANAGGTPKPSATTQSIPDDIKAAKKKLWDVLKSVRGSQNDWQQANQFMWDEAIIDPTMTVATMTAAELLAAAQRAEVKLKEIESLK